MDGLPFLPGNSFQDHTQTRHHVSQTLSYRNGYQVPHAYAKIGIGGKLLPMSGLSESDLDDLANFQPSLTYGKAKPAPPQDFVPAHVAFDKKVLRFYGYFKETVHESPNEHFRVRHIILYYYLEDDSIAIVEPPRENSGIPQGKLIRRQRIPKNEVGDIYSWKDVNLGINLSIYGRSYRITNCDQYTKDFLESEGVIVGQPEEVPEDPYLSHRQDVNSIRTYKTPVAFDKRKQFLEMDRKVLRFYAVWDDREQPFGEVRPFMIHYYLVDDTMEIRECHTANDGRDPFPVLIRRGKIPKNPHDVTPTFPAVVMELSATEIKEYFSPKDFRVGSTVLIMGRRFLIYDCDNFTKSWYYQHFGITEFSPVDVAQVSQELAKMEIPPYNKFGTLEDSLGSCLGLVPEAPRKDYVKMSDNDTKLLRYECYMDSIRPEDKGRRFILSYRLADDMITIFETPVRNSGVVGGTFLQRTRVAKPGSSADKPCYYGPADFSIGAKIETFGHRFVITNADEFVLTFLEAHPEQVPPEVLASLRERLSQPDARQSREVVKGGPVKLRREDGDIRRTACDIIAQLKRMSITDRPRIDEMFLRYNCDRNQLISVPNMQEMCRKMQLPDDEDISAAIIEQLGTNGVLGLEEFRKFFES